MSDSKARTSSFAGTALDTRDDVDDTKSKYFASSLPPSATPKRAPSSTQLTSCSPSYHMMKKEGQHLSKYFSSTSPVSERPPASSSDLPRTPEKSTTAPSQHERSRDWDDTPSTLVKKRKLEIDTLTTPSKVQRTHLKTSGSSTSTLHPPLTPRRTVRLLEVSPTRQRTPSARRKPPSPFENVESKYFARTYASDPLLEMSEEVRASLLARLQAAKPVLIQETFSEDPWKVLIATIFLNKTHGKISIPVIHTLLASWNTPSAMAAADPSDVYPLIRHLGLGAARARRIVDLSQAWIARSPTFEDEPIVSKSSDLRRYPPTILSHLPGIGRYALDSFRIFCTTMNNKTRDEWKAVRPTDKELTRFLAWKWAYVEHRRWHPERGPMGYADAQHIEQLVQNLASTTPGTTRTASLTRRAPDVAGASSGGTQPPS
ncbi:DNA glycosylase [Schizophyllum amplum]|uniref:DNA glycosylase n=1 Tax=Schizophyllum amplum TaxID=97359 RepID=A0A550BZL3_9AGAR|nr:DNA glycosylase [Auriculariopsis ampla]